MPVLQRNAAARATAANLVIAELNGPAAHVVATYRSDAPAARDFVFVEEGVSGALADAGILDAAEHAAACGAVFSWLLTNHGVRPPEWWVRAVGKLQLQRTGRTWGIFAVAIGTQVLVEGGFFSRAIAGRALVEMQCEQRLGQVAR
jgi:hypothetical protein